MAWRRSGLTREMVLRIKCDTRRPYKIIAYDYNISISQVWKIINNKQWTDVK